MGDIKGKPLDERGPGEPAAQYSVKSKVISVGDATPRGYTRADLYDVWVRYLPRIAAKSATSATSATSAKSHSRKMLRMPRMANATAPLPAQQR